MTATLGGLWPALLSPLDPQGRPNRAAVEQLVELFAQQQLDGLYVTGSTGQWPLLTIEERQAIIEWTVQAAAGRLRIMAHVGAVTTQDTVRLARHAEAVGVDAVSTVAPIYYSHSADVVFDFYRTVGAATGRPLFVYHLSLVNQLRLPPAEYVDRLLGLPNIAGMKITDVDLNLFGLLHTHAGSRLQLFSGADEVMCHAVLSGACGAIGTFYNLWGPACRAARQAAVEGRVAVAAEFMSRFQSAISQVIRSGSVWTFLRAAMLKKYGIDVGVPRAPLGALDKPWSDSEVARLLTLVDGEAV